MVAIYLDLMNISCQEIKTKNISQSHTKKISKYNKILSANLVTLCFLCSAINHRLVID